MQNQNHKTIHFMAPGGWRFFLVFALLTAYTLFVMWIDDHGVPIKSLAKADDTLGISVVMGMIFVFRLNSAYDRWWEGRKLWGQLVNETRNLALKARELAAPEAQEAAAFAQLLIAFPYALRDHLRGKTPTERIPESQRSNFTDVKHVPMAIAGLVYKQMRGWNKQKLISDIDLQMLDRHARTYMDVAGACERILKSPISKTIKIVFWLGILLYSLVTPWILVPDNHDSTLIMTLLAIYFVLALEFVAQEAENPFGTAANDLPLDSICLTIENSVREVFQ